VLEGVNAIGKVRQIVGSTDPSKADMGTIRGDYSLMSFQYSNSIHKAVPNLIHASGNCAEAKQEIALWFADDELFDYSTLAEKFVR